MKPNYEQTIAAIERVALPAVVNPAMRREPRKLWAAGIRALLRRLGIDGISVTTPVYSMANSIGICLPLAPDHSNQAHEFATCEICQRRVLAIAKLRRIILAAFPDLDDRSEYQTDYFEFCFSID